MSRDRSACSFLAMRVPRTKALPPRRAKQVRVLWRKNLRGLLACTTRAQAAHRAAATLHPDGTTVRLCRRPGQGGMVTRVGWLTGGTPGKNLLWSRARVTSLAGAGPMMTMSSAIRGRQGLLGAAGVLALLASNGLAAEASSWRIERGDVKILVPLKPGGAFTATTPSLAGTLTLEGAKPAHLAGEVSMDLATIDTGISLRNQHLRENYLDVAKGEGFNKAVLSDIHLSDVGGETFEGT